MSEINGYVVTGKHFDTSARVWLAYEPIGTHVIVPRITQATTFKTVGSAIQAWCDAQAMCSDARIFAVAEDGTETPLPSYEEALAELDSLRAVLLDGAPGDLVQAAKGDEAACDKIVAAIDKLRLGLADIERLWTAMRSIAALAVTCDEVDCCDTYDGKGAPRPATHETTLFGAPVYLCDRHAEGRIESHRRAESKSYGKQPDVVPYTQHEAVQIAIAALAPRERTAS